LKFPVLVHPSRTFEGWPPKDWIPGSPLPAPETFELVPLESAISAEYEGPAHIYPYSIPGETVGARLRKDSYKTAIMESTGASEDLWADLYCPRVYALFVDIDTKGHLAWRELAARSGGPVAALDALGEALGAATVSRVLGRLPAALRGGFGGYATRRGARLYAPLGPGLPVDRFEGFARAVLAALAPAIEGEPLEIDDTCTQWTRCYLLPNVVRDGTKERPVIFRPSRDINPYILSASLGVKLEPEGGSAPDTAALAGFAALELPEQRGDGELDVSIGNRSVIRGLFNWLRDGKPAPPDDTGHSYPTIRRAFMRAGELAGIQDPAVLFAVFWPSIRLESPKRQLELWKLAKWAAAVEIKRKAENHPIDPRDFENSGPPLPEDTPEPTVDDWAKVKEWIGDVAYRLQAGDRIHAHKIKLGPILQKAVRDLAREGLVTDPRVIWAFVRKTAAAGETAGGPKTLEVWDWCVSAAVVAAEMLEDEDNWQSNPEFVGEYCKANPIFVSVGGKALYCLEDPLGRKYRRTDAIGYLSDFREFSAPSLQVDITIPPNLPMRMVVDKYGTTANKLAYRSLLQGARLESDSGGDRLVVEGVHRLLPVKPTYSQTAAEYLELLLNSDLERGLDWLAAFARTDRPCAALVLRGDPGTGKDLLVKALSLLSSGYMTFEEATAKHNTKALDTWLIYAEEGLSPAKYEDGRKLTQDFRRFVTQNVFGVEEKFQRATTIECAFRLIVTMNPPDGIQFQSIEDKADIEAIKQRIVYVEAHPAAADYLNAAKDEYGGELSPTWIGSADSPGLLVRHIAYLIESRRQTLEDRQGKEYRRGIVSGNSTPWHDRFQFRQRTTATILAAIAESVAKPFGPLNLREIDGSARVIKVTAEAVLNSWPDEGTKKPLRSEVTHSLRALCGPARSERVRVNVAEKATKSVYIVGFDMLLAAGALEPEDLDTAVSVDARGHITAIEGGKDGTEKKIRGTLDRSRGQS
jgi:hypothetical protein